jgi:hypothetical protein
MVVTSLLQIEGASSEQPLPLVVPSVKSLALKSE